MDINTKLNIEYLCSINKHDHAVALYISQFISEYNDSYGYELYRKLREFRINYVPYSILHEVFSMELYLLYHRFGENVIDPYYDEYESYNFARELQYVVIAEEEYAKHIFSLIAVKVDEVDMLENLLRNSTL